MYYYNTMTLLVVQSANGDGSSVLFQGKFQYMSNCNCVILRINRARCTLNKEILDLLNEESVSGACSGKS